MRTGTLTMSQERLHIPRNDDTKISSRLIVKNIPKYVDDARLKEHFGSHGEVTDCKVIRTREGQSRCFGFVGFASSADAAAAQKYYDKTFMDATRLDVDFAQKYGSEAKKNAWSKYTEGTSRYKEQQRSATGANAVDVAGARNTEKPSKATPDDPKLQEFLELMQPRHKKAVWSNDDGIQGAVTAAQQQNLVFDGVNKHDESSEEEYEQQIVELPDARVKTRDEEQDDVKVDDVVVNNTNVSDLDYLKSRVAAAFSDDEEGDDEEGDDEEGDEMPGHGQDDAHNGDGDVSEDGEGQEAIERQDIEVARLHEPHTANGLDDELIQETARLFLRNLPYSANEDDIRTLLEQYGELDDVHIIVDKSTRKSKGYALVTFVDCEDAVRAFKELDGSIFMGRLLHILPGKAAPRNEDGMDSQKLMNATSSYKKDKELKMKQEASNKVAWNTLFMRSDTVAEAVADMYNMTKSDLLDPSASDMAVRLALGEVKVIHMTKEYLEENGVQVELLEAAAQASGKGNAGHVKRSDTVLIVKNLPFVLDEQELKSMFTNIGTVLRWVLPPSHTLALVEFSSNQDASRAFKSLTFKRYKSVPIYLEWAPRDIFDSRTKQVVSKELDQPEKREKKMPEKKELSAAISTLIKDTGVSDADSSTIFVKNLAFKTKKQSLEKHFKTVVRECGGELKSAKIAQRTKDGKQVSAGFGFIECSSESSARDVIQRLQGSSLDGHQLVLQLSQNHSSSGSKNKEMHVMKQQASTKVLVRNLAFEATRQDVLNLFTALAEVKSCRLPKKFDGSHRGFAFVEFASASEAKTAMKAISGTHLYGRRLVLEWAADEDGEDATAEDPPSATKVRKRKVLA